MMRLSDVRFEPVSEFADTFTLDAFKELVAAGCYNDDDGSGYYGSNFFGKHVDHAPGTLQQSNIACPPSNIARADFHHPVWATHVIWFNK